MSTTVRTTQAFGRARIEQIGEQVVIAKPVPLFIKRHQKHLIGLQMTDDCGAVMAVTNRIAQLSAEALHAGGVIKELLYLGGLPLDDFLEQVFTDQPFTTVQLKHLASFRQFLDSQQPEA